MNKNKQKKILNNTKEVKTDKKNQSKRKTNKNEKKDKVKRKFTCPEMFVHKSLHLVCMCVMCQERSKALSRFFSGITCICAFFFIFLSFYLRLIYFVSVDGKMRRNAIEIEKKKWNFSMKKKCQRYFSYFLFFSFNVKIRFHLLKLQ